MNPFLDYLTNQASSIQRMYDAQYEDALKNFSQACSEYQAFAQRQYDIDGTILPPPKVPTKKTCTVLNNTLVEGTWVDPNLHPPVFVPAKVIPSSGLPDISNAVTLDQVALMEVMNAKKLDAIMTALKIPLV